MTTSRLAAGGDPLGALAEAGVLAVVRAPDRDSAVRGIHALVQGGITGIEVTYSTPGAPEVIATIAEQLGDRCYVGAGTVLTVEQAVTASDAGARFLVSPGLDDEVLAAMLATGRITVAGGLTPTEIMRAHRLGAHAVKVFPASIGGPHYLRALRAPFPDVPLIPTGGVDATNLGAWFAAGAVAVGAGGELCSPADLAAGGRGGREGAPVPYGTRPEPFVTG